MTSSAPDLTSARMRKPDLSPDVLAAAVRNIPDFPQPGIQFKDITPVLADAELFAGCVDLLTADVGPGSIDAVVGIDARGFIFAAAAALKLHSGFVPIRKKGKLPYTTHEETYSLEYGTNTVAIHVDALKPGSRVLLIDDLLATGGTAAAAASLVRRAGAQIVGITFFIELGFLQGRERLKGFPVRSLVIY
jgi:adenine phosphoribosyltransferase